MDLPDFLLALLDPTRYFLQSIIFCNLHACGAYAPLLPGLIGSSTPQEKLIPEPLHTRFFDKKVNERSSPFPLTIENEK